MVREIAQRSGNGITVTLSWDDESGALVLLLDDRGALGMVEVAAAQAHDAFWHPFLYVTPEDPADVETWSRRD